MPWCPKCKNEYREGIRICSDCGCELVEEGQLAEISSVVFGEEEQLNELKKYLEFNKVRGAAVRFSEEEGMYELVVCTQDRAKALPMAKVFLKERETSREAGMVSEMFSAETAPEGKVDGSTAEEEETVHTSAGLYQNSTERAEDNRSSAWTLMLVGAVGLVVMVLGIMDVIPLRIGNPYMFYGVMSAVFILFLVMGVVSMKNAKIFARKAESENTLRDTMKKWALENLDAAAIDESLGLAGDAEGAQSSEMLYFKRAKKLKDMFNHQFMNLDQAFLEHFIDEEIYDSIFSDHQEEK